jgi:hypothetical protein
MGNMPEPMRWVLWILLFVVAVLLLRWALAMFGVNLG